MDRISAAQAAERLSGTLLVDRRTGPNMIAAKDAGGPVRLLIDGQCVFERELEGPHRVLLRIGHALEASAMTGKLEVAGDCDTVTTMSGDVYATTVHGSVNTLSGDINIGRWEQGEGVPKPVSVSGHVRVKRQAVDDPDK